MCVNDVSDESNTACMYVATTHPVFDGTILVGPRLSHCRRVVFVVGGPQSHHLVVWFEE